MEKKQNAPTTKGPAERFVGDVYATEIAGQDDPSPLVAALVRFAPAARTNWHSHAFGQTLHVTEGFGLVATRDGTVAHICAGDTVHASPGEEHWHGAGVGTVMSHVAMAPRGDDGPATTWLEPVSDEEFEAAHLKADSTTSRNLGEAGLVPEQVGVRRVVTGLDANGRSGFVTDEATTTRVSRPDGSVVMDVWRVDGLPAHQLAGGPLAGEVRQHPRAWWPGCGASRRTRTWTPRSKRRRLLVPTG
jgi:quercetin dioxygenase-like cupin family protein